MNNDNRNDHVNPFAGAPIISRYTRADAIDDGTLIDVSTVAREAGIRFPVAITAGVWGRCVEVPPGVECQDEADRLWDVVWMLRCSMARSSGSRVDFGVHVRNDSLERTPPLVMLCALCHPGDSGEPVVTVVVPGED